MIYPSTTTTSNPKLRILTILITIIISMGAMSQTTIKNKSDNKASMNQTTESIQRVKSDSIAIGEGPEYILYSTIGFNTNGVMTQKSVTDELIITENIDLTDNTNIKTVNGMIISESTNKWVNSSNETVLLIKIIPGKKLYLVPNSETSLIYSLLYDNSSISGNNGAFADGYTSTITISAGTERLIDIPTNGNYLYLVIKKNGIDQTPSVCAYFESIKGKLSDVGAIINNNTDVVTTLGNRISSIEENIENSSIETIEEIYEGWDYMTGAYIKNDGSIASKSTFAYSSFVPLSSLGDDDLLNVNNLIFGQSYKAGYYYDVNKSLLTSDYITSENITIAKKDMPAGSAYIRLNFSNDTYPTIKFIRNGKSRVEKLVSTINDMNTEIITINTFTNNKYISSSDGSVVSITSGYLNNNVKVTDYIDIKGATAVHSSNSNLRSIRSIYGTSNSSVATIAFYDSNKSFISNTASHNKYAECPPGAAYIRCTILATASENVITLYGVSSNDQINTLSEDVSKISGSIETGLTGKKVAFIGDSMTAGAGNGVTKDNVYHKIFANLMGCTNVNLGVNGSTIASGTGRSTFVSRATQENLGDVDMVVIFGGTNDFTYDKKAIGPLFIEESQEAKGHIGNRRKVAPTDTDCFAGALHNLIVTVRGIVGEKPIVLMTPLNRGRYTDSNYTTPTTSIRPSSRDCNANGDYLSDFVDTIKEIGRFYGIPVFDAGGIINFDPTDRSSSNYTGDLLHPNYKMHLRLGNMLYKWVCDNIFINE